MPNNHEMIADGHGHGLSHCEHCLATDREIAFALGPVCPVKREPDITAAEGVADGLVKRVLAEIADMMSQHVANWPYPRKIDTAIALISKTLDAALTNAVPRDVAETWKTKAENLSAARKEAATTITRLTAENARQAAEIEGLRSELGTFLALWATQYARNMGLPSEHVFALHYDRMAELGLRMDDFIRVETADRALTGGQP